MPLFKKAILRVGTYQSPDGEVKVTPKRLKHWAATHRRMMANRLGVPISFDHADDDADLAPVAFSTGRGPRSAKDSVGFLKSIEVAPDGNHANIILDIRDPKAIQKARENVVEVSPVVFPTWQDGRGKNYRDCITHLDLVNHPVDNSQGQFSEVNAIACCLRMGLADSKKTKLFRMAEDDSMDENAAPNDDDKSGNDDEGDSSTVNNDGRLKKVIDALVGMNIVLSEDTNEENFLEHLEQALLTAQAQEGDIDEPGDPTDAEDLDAVGPSIAALGLQGRTALSYAQRTHRKDLTTRLVNILRTGRCTPVEHKQKLSAMDSVRLSLNKGGNPISSRLEDWIADREKIPAGSLWDTKQRIRMSNADLDSTNPPKDLINEVSREDAEKLADEVLGTQKTA